MTRSSFVFRLTRGGGPPPVPELHRVFEAAQNDPGGVSWIATRKPGAGFSTRPDSRLLAFADGEGGTSWALTARVISRHATLPSDALVRDMYGDFEGGVFLAYWKITDVVLKHISLRGPSRNDGERLASAGRVSQEPAVFRLLGAGSGF